MNSVFSISPVGRLVLGALGLAVGLWPGVASAELRFAHIFQDNMVLQRDQPVAVWGEADPGAAVEVVFGEQRQRGQADQAGQWKVLLATQPASAVGTDLTVTSGGAAITRSNVLVGEVWIAAGQSNMVHAGSDLDTGVYPHYVSPGSERAGAEVRIARFGWGASLEPMNDIDPAGRADKPWTVLAESPAEAKMNIPQYFGRILRDVLEVPVGVVHVAHSGTNQAAWMQKEVLETFPGEGGGKNFYESFLAAREQKLATSKKGFKSWAEFKAAEDAWRGEQKGLWPGRGMTYVNFPSALYNTRIHPLAPFAVRGVIWHQGEGGPRGPYAERLVAMFGQWRELFGQDFYLLWGTLSRSTVSQQPLGARRGSFYRSITNVDLRNALDLSAEDSKSGFVEFYDLGNDDTHFDQKAEAGRRMALAALTLAYQKPLLYSGPRLKSCEIQPGKATVTFELAGKGLTYTPSIDGISGFYLRSPSGETRWADVVVVDANTLELSHKDLATIETVGYGAHPNPHETVFNSDGLPASPFTVNPVATKDPGQQIKVATLEAAPDGTVLHLSHLRRDGYVMKPKKRKLKGSETATLLAYIPEEWPAAEVLIDGAPVAVESVEDAGRKYLRFDAPVNGGWIVVGREGKATKFTKINRY